MSFIRNWKDILVKQPNGETIYEMLTERDGSPIGIARVYVRESKLHHHDHTEEWYIITGAIPNGEVYLNGKKFSLLNYDLVYIAPGTRHKLKAKTLNSLEIIAITCPPWSSEDHHLDE